MSHLSTVEIITSRYNCLQSISSLALSVLFVFVSTVLSAEAGSDTSLILSRDSSQSQSPIAQDTIELSPYIAWSEHSQQILLHPRRESLSLDAMTWSIDRSQMDAWGYTSVMQALSQVPGTWVETRGRKVYQFASLRGQAYPYPDYSLDGIWQQELSEMPYLLSTLDLERIQVIRSSGALLTSMTGAAGVIDLQSRQYDSLSLRTQGEIGSYGTLNLGVIGGVNQNDFAVRGGISHFQVEGPEGENAERRHSNLMGALRWSPNDQWLLQIQSFALLGYYELYKAQAPAQQNLQTSEDRFDPIEGLSGSFQSLWRPLPNFSLELLLSGMGRVQNFEEVIKDSLGHKDHRDVDYETTLSLMAAWLPFKETSLRTGLNHNRWLAPDGKRFYEGFRQDVHTWSWVSVVEQAWVNWIADAGIRLNLPYYERFTPYHWDSKISSAVQKAEPRVKEWGDLEPNAALGLAWNVYSFFSLGLHGNYSVIQSRPGSLTDKGLEPKSEDRQKIDFGVIYKTKTIGTASVATFFVNQNNALYYTGKLSTSDNGSVLENYGNIDRRQWGVEGNWESVRISGVSISGGATWMRSEQNEKNVWVTDEQIPYGLAQAEISWKGMGFESRLKDQYVSDYWNSRFSADKQNHQLGDFHNLSMLLAYELSKKQSYRVYCRIENLLDEKYSTAVGYPDVGMTAYLGLQVGIL